MNILAHCDTDHAEGEPHGRSRPSGAAPASSPAPSTRVGRWTRASGYDRGMAKDPIPLFTADVLRGITDVLGATDDGLTGSEIAHNLAQVRVLDVNPGMTKRYRLFNALAERQNKDRVGNCVEAFMTRAMSPVHYRDDPAGFFRRQADLNEVLVFAGYRINDEGKVVRPRGGKASTLDEAAERANTIRVELRRRDTHPDVLRYCTSELLKKNNFHALLEASKSMPDRIRLMTGETSDGAELIQATVTPSSGPLVAINAGATETDRKEQSGFANLIIGLLGLYRNPTAHDPKLHRTVSDEELLEALTTMSMVHRRLDDARLT